MHHATTCVLQRDRYAINRRLYGADVVAFHITNVPTSINRINCGVYMSRAGVLLENSIFLCTYDTHTLAEHNVHTAGASIV